MGSTQQALSSAVRNGARLSRSEQRRTPRVQIRIPLLLASDGLCEPCWTLDANDTGALVSCPQPVEAGTRVTLFNVGTSETAVARVIATLLSTAGPEVGFRLALQLEGDTGCFWGPAYESAALISP